MIASVVVALDRVLLKLLSIDVELGSDKYYLFVPAVILLVIAGVLDWPTILKFIDRYIGFMSGTNPQSRAEAEGVE